MHDSGTSNDEKHARSSGHISICAGSLHTPTIVSTS
jgi:hypothetical protein